MRSAYIEQAPLSFLPSGKGSHPQEQTWNLELPPEPPKCSKTKHQLFEMYNAGKTITEVALCYLCISFSLPAQHLVNVMVTSDHLDSSAAFLGSEKPFQQHRVT